MNDHLRLDKFLQLLLYHPIALILLSAVQYTIQRGMLVSTVAERAGAMEIFVNSSRVWSQVQYKDSLYCTTL